MKKEVDSIHRIILVLLLEINFLPSAPSHLTYSLAS